MQASDILTSIEDLTRSRPCRVVFRRFGRHRFGGSPAIQYSGIAPPAPIHHFLTLDTEDKRSPIRLRGIQYVPLVYPLAYSEGGGEVSYRVLGDNRIKITHLSDYDPSDNPYFLLDELPERSASLKPLTYAERRIASSNIRDKSLLDRWRMKRLWNGECFRVGGMCESHSKLGSGPCPRQDNDSGEACSFGWKFAWFHATKRPFGDIWYEYSSDVRFCFAICYACGTIHAFNECG